MQELIESIESKLVENGFVYNGNTDPYYRRTPAGTYFYIFCNAADDMLEIGYGITPGIEQMGIIAALCDCSQCLKFTLHIKTDHDIDGSLEAAAGTIKEFYDAHARLSPEELGTLVKARRDHFYSLVTDELAPYGFIRKWADRQQWLLDPENNVYIEIKLESVPALVHSMLVVIRDRRDPGYPTSYWKNVPINGGNRIYWEDICDEYLTDALRYAITDIVLPVMRAGVEKLIDSGYFVNEKNGWAEQLHDPKPSALLNQLMAAIEALGMNRAEERAFRYYYYIRYDHLTAFCLNINETRRGLLVRWGAHYNAQIYQDIDPVKRVGAHHTNFRPCFEQLIASENDIPGLTASIKQHRRMYIPWFLRLRAHLKKLWKGN